MSGIAITKKEKTFILTTIRRFFPSASIFFFGSRVRGNHKAYSDLDICLDIGERLNLVQLSKLNEVFTESDLPYKIDISDWHRITQDFQNLISSECIRG